MNGDNMLALILGMIIGLIIIKGMVWLVMKAKEQSRTSTTVTRSSNGSIHIQAGDGDLHITGRIKPGDSDFHITSDGEELVEEEIDLKKNLLD